EWGGHALHEACFEPWREEKEKYERACRAWDESHSGRDGHLKRDPRPKRPAWLEKKYWERVQYVRDCEAHRRGERATPPEPTSGMKASEIRERAWEASHPPKPKPKGGDNVIHLSPNRERERAIAAIQRESSGLDYERATWLYYFRNKYALPEHQ